MNSIEARLVSRRDALPLLGATMIGLLACRPGSNLGPSPVALPTPSAKPPESSPLPTITPTIPATATVAPTATETPRPTATVTSTPEPTQIPTVEKGYRKTWGNVTLATDTSLQDRQTNPIQRVILNPDIPDAKERLNDVVLFGHARALKITLEELKSRIAAGEDLTYNIIGSQGEGDTLLKPLKVNAAKPVTLKFAEQPTTVYATEALGFSYSVLESGELMITISYKGSEASSWEGALTHALGILDYPTMQTGRRDAKWPNISDPDLQQFIKLVRVQKGNSTIPLIKAVK